MMKNFFKKQIKQRFCNHSEWDCDSQIRVIRCRECGKEAWIKEYTNFMSNYDHQCDSESDLADIIFDVVLRSLIYMIIISAALSALLLAIIYNIK